MKYYSKNKSLLMCVGVYALALLVAMSATLFLPTDCSTFYKALIADIVATLVVYAFSLLFGNASMYDPYWSVIPPAIAIYWQNESVAELSTAAILLHLGIWIWAARLTINWIRGWSGLNHQDWRYTMLKEKNPGLYWLTNLGGIHIFPTIMVFLGLIPVYYFMQQTVDISPVFLLGFILCIAASTIEYVSDEQMRTFKKTAEKGAFINTGLWKYSRHPNYFGEILFWFSIWVMAMSASTHYWYTGIGWVSMLAMFSGASVPMMEAKNRASKKDYHLYEKATSALIPWLPKTIRK
jgi:steroid 5-alpha reductase family enzyme